ncbi:DASH family cryptochrome [Halomarina ordinaria]|uniref:Cryptochrome DASH n=1 Tax=Halomarina ordinaria TaxID=3033939 RepID=A0ABD5U5C9_9EURY|nr:DASH family cryptochrome [Halomarina sp. PSRA2]
MGETALVWFRADLRVHDNDPLRRAARAERTVPLYCFDPRTFEESAFGLPKTGPHRARFLRESVADLRASLRDLGGDLLVRVGPPEDVVPEVASECDVDIVHHQTLPATEERSVGAGVEEALEPTDVHVERHWTHTLYHPEDLASDVDGIPDTFTPWRKETEAECEVREQAATPASLTLPDVDTGDVPTHADLGVPEPADDDRAVLRFRGGETAGCERLDEYVWTGDHLREYKRTRNGLLGADYSSKVSPWLAHGCLSPRFVHDEVRRYERERVATEDTYWLVFELLWRDFFQFQFEKHGGAFFTRSGIRDVEKGWSTDREAFARWAAGETGVPFVDANVRELNETGYMSNRGRQNVASFLTDVLGLDWRLGAAYFESRLVDYDPCSNWGNWAYVAGVGNHSRDGHFDVRWQAENYDPDGAYVRTWVPELAAVPGDAVHRPWDLTDDRQALYDARLGVDYPRPMVDVDARYDALD